MRNLNWDKGIKGCDGITRSRQEIENYFISLFFKKIDDKITELIAKWKSMPEFKMFKDELSFIKRHLKGFLLAEPEEMDRFCRIWDKIEQKYLAEAQRLRRVQEYTDRLSTVKSELLETFNYKGFRETYLNRMAIILNVKSCMYCNQQYTIVVGKNLDSKGDRYLAGSDAFLQFDHFFNKKKYPFFSMSLYNLIPSCPVCNQKKSDKPLPLSLHPFTTHLSDKIRFSIKDPDAFINPANINLDTLDVEISTSNPTLDILIKDLALKDRYSRHLDIVEDLECALYMERYYSQNFFPFMADMGEFTDENNRQRLSLALQRHMKGFYHNPSDINRRPLTKFCQDIYLQLCSLYSGE